MSFRKVIFWSHLVAGVAAGLVILMMSATGVLLTYERQMIASAEADRLHVPDRPHLALDDLIDRVAEYYDTDGALEFTNDPSSPARLFKGRQKQLVNPVTGAAFGAATTETERTLRTIRGIHRWFGLSGDSRATGKAITGIANLLFIFLAVSGAYLWLPPLFKKAAFKTRLMFRKSYVNSHARDYNWHHVFSVWMLVPIFVMATTATVFSYRWAHELVYAAYGEDPPQRGRSAPQVAQTTSAPTITLADAASLDERFETVQDEFENWRFIRVPMDAELLEPTVFEVDTGNGTQYGRKYDVTVSPTGTISRIHQPFYDRTPGSQARVIVRFLHTGEVLGVIGQTLAGLGSLAGIFLVYTGLALAYRRLIRPLFRK